MSRSSRAHFANAVPRPVPLVRRALWSLLLLVALLSAAVGGIAATTALADNSAAVGGVFAAPGVTHAQQASRLRPATGTYDLPDALAPAASATVFGAALRVYDPILNVSPTPTLLVARSRAAEEGASAIDQAASKVPDEWGPGQSARTGGGWRWSDPNGGPGENYIRVDPGDPASPNPLQQVAHVHVSSGGVQVANHLPLDEWLGWGSWSAP